MESNFEQLVAVVLTEAEEKEGPFSVQELAASLNTGEGKRHNQLLAALDKLCIIGILAPQGDKWIHTSNLDKKTDEATHSQPSTPIVPEPKGDSASAVPLRNNNRMMSFEASAPIDPVPVSRAEPSTTSSLQVTNFSNKSVVSNDSSPTSVENINYIFCQIIQVLRSSETPLKAVDVARQSKLGNAKSDVNRYLYCLEKKGVLKQNYGRWSFIQEIEESDLAMAAVQLANQKPSKKTQAKSGGQSTSCEYGCVPTGGNCYHFKQENHYHNTIVQVGDGNKFQVRSPGVGQENDDGNHNLEPATR